MRFFKVFFPFLFAVSTLLVIPNVSVVGQRPQHSLSVLSWDLFGALRPGGPRTFDRILVGENPAWRDFRQEIEGEGVWTAGQIFSSFAWGHELGTGVNPAVILVTYGVTYDWALPPDGDLASRVDAIREALDQAYSAWYRGEVDRARYPQIANGPTYALYRFFQGDLHKLEAWKVTFEDIFGLVPDQPLPQRRERASIDEIAPFLRRPFDQLFGTDHFYHVSSFFDHHYPLYSLEGDRTDMYRFDGLVFEDIPEPDACGTDGDTGSGTYCYSGHPAYDYPVVDGAPVKAAADGEMILCDSRWGALFIQHENGLVTSYLHMDPLEIPGGVECADVAEERPQVVQGQVIGYVSNKNGYGDPGYPVHLHFGVGHEADIRERQNIDPFGWWGKGPDPWEHFQHSEYPGQKSKWLWLGDERSDGLLTVDNSETQAQLFNAPYASGDWNWVDHGYPEPEGDAWYAHLSYQPNRTAIYWGIWGVNIEQPGFYQVQAYWPSDPDPDAVPEPARKVVYTLYYHDAQGQVRSVRLYADQSRDANQFVTLCAVPYGDNPAGCPEYPEIYFGPGPSVVILRDVSEEPVKPGKYMVFFDAIRWQQAVFPVPTYTATPTATPTSTPNPPGGSICPLPEEPTLCYQVYSGGLPVTDSMQVDCPNCQWAARCTDFVLNDWRIAGARWPFDNWASWIIGSNSPHWVEITFQVFDENPRQGWEVCSGWVEVGTQMGTRPWRALPAVEGCGLHTEIIWPDRYPVAYSTGHLPLTYRLCAWRDSGVRLENIKVHEWRFVTIPTPTLTPTPTPTPIPTSTPTPIPVKRTPSPTATTKPCLLEHMQFQIPGLQDLTLFYQVREKLAQTSAGERYVAMYYRYSPALIRLLQRDPETRLSFSETVRVWRPALQSWVMGQNASLSREQTVALQRFLSLLTERGDPSLQAIVTQEMRRIPWARLDGMRMKEVETLLLETESASQNTTFTSTPQP